MNTIENKKTFTTIMIKKELKQRMKDRISHMNVKFSYPELIDFLLKSVDKNLPVNNES